ncbi:MAG: ATP-binding protein [Anaerolineae bacterium]
MGRAKVLVIDDEPVVLDLCRRILEAEGYQVVTATDGWEGIEQLRQETFDAVLTDIKMPGLDGLETLQIMREVQPNLVSVVMTGFSTMDLAIQAIKLGVDEFVVKPFTPLELSHALSRALEKVQLRQENARLRAIVPLGELSRTFLRTVELQPLMQEVVEIARRETGADRVVLLAAADPKAQDLTLAALAGYEEEAAAALLGKAFLRGEVLPQESQWQVLSAQAHQGYFRPLLESLDMASAILTPLTVKEGALGILIVGWAPELARFGPGHPEFLAVLGAQAAIAMDNARLFGDIQRAYRELQALDHLKSEFINVAAHELRTPIAILMGYASLLEEEAPEELKEPLAIMARNAERLSSLVTNLLDLERLQTGATLVSVEPVSLAEVVRDVVADFRPLAESKQVSLETSLQEAMPSVQTDRQKLELVIANLVSNAVKFTPSGGKVLVRATMGDGDQGLVIQVEDTGVGIPAAELDKIFEPFYQTEASLTRKHEGMGLGLSIVRGMMNLLGGKVSVKSEVGRGSIFTIALPASPSKKASWSAPCSDPGEQRREEAPGAPIYTR